MIRSQNHHTPEYGNTALSHSNGSYTHQDKWCRALRYKNLFCRPRCSSIGNIKKHIYIVFGLLLAISHPSQGKESSSVGQSANASVVCLKTLINDGLTRSGSGFVVAPGIVATVTHQIANATRVVAYLSDGTYQIATLPPAAQGKEIALLAVPTNAPYLSLNPEDPAPKEKVFTIGCSSNLAHSLSRGTVSHPRRWIEGRQIIQTNLTINKGNSGAPLLNRNGSVVGIIYGYVKNANEISLVVPVDELRELMAQIGLGPEGVAKSEVIQLWENAQRTQDTELRLSVYSEILKKAPWITEAIYNQGVIYFERKQFDKAKERFELSIRQRPQYYQAYANLGLTLYKLGKPAEARDTLIDAILINTEYSIAFLNLCIVYQRGLSDLRSAKHAFLRYLELNPNSTDEPEVRRWLQEIDESLSSQKSAQGA